MIFRNLFFLGVLSFFFIMPTNQLHADTIDTTSESKNTEKFETSIGYRSVSEHGTSARAREYDSLLSSPTFKLSYEGANESNNLNLDLNFINEDDFYFENDFNLKAGLRINILKERMFHNLDHIPYDQASEQEARPDGVFNGTTRIDYFDQDPGTDYGIRIDQSEVSTRVKVPDYPAHINIKYWRWEKKGKKQLRYANDSCTSCHLQSRTQDIDRVTEEVTASIDAHLGFFDLSIEQVVRTFDDRASTSVDTFEENWMLQAGDYEHDANPDSKFTQSTIKANSVVSGGFVADTSFSIGKRENDASYTDISVDSAETKFQKLASNVTYTPSSHWTMNFRYRLLDMDTDNSSYISADGLQYATFPPPTYAPTLVSRTSSIDVRDSIDITRDYYAASLAYRPSTQVTFKGDYRREDIHRSNTNGPIPHDAITVDPVEIDPYWELPEDEVLQKYRLSFSSRLLPKNALKLEAWYQYQTSDDPAYSISVESGHKGYASATYHSSPLWGGTMSIKMQDVKNTDAQYVQFDGSDTPVTFEQNRRQEGQNAALGLWLNARAGVRFDLNYGYLRSRIIQDLLFGSEPDLTIEDEVEYRQSVHTLALGANWQMYKFLTCRVEGYHIRSEVTYSPNFPTESLTVGVASSEDLQEISKVDIRQNGLKGRVNWEIDEKWTAIMQATYDDYDDYGSDVFDGSVQTYTASISRVW